VDAYDSDPPSQKLLAALTLQSPQGHFTLVQGVIKYKDKIWVGNNLTMQHKIMQALHCSQLGDTLGSL
jgi:hypothetical protein